MKILFILLSFLSIPGDFKPFKKFITIIPANWTYEINNNNLIITRKDSIEFTYCRDISPIRNEPIHKAAYTITVEAAERISKSEIKRRLLLQDSILAEYQRNYDFKRIKLLMINLALLSIIKILMIL